MRHLIVLLACLALVAGLGYAAVQVNRDYLHQVAHNIAQSNAAKAAQQQVEAAQVKDLQGQVTKLQAQCQNGLLAYGLLTATQREHIVKPDCAL